MIVLIVIRSFIFAVLYLPFLLFSSFTFAVLNLLFNSRKIDNYVLTIWGWLSCLGCGVRVRVKGNEKIPESMGGIFLFNHTSFFDIFAMHTVLTNFRFGAKIELFKIPIFGWAMHRAGALPIDRSKREEVYKIYEVARARLEKGERFALAPEGTRQTEEKLGSFKSGPFIFAIGAQAPIFPVVIKGAAGILPKRHFLPNLKAWTSYIDIEVLDPVSSEGYTMAQRQELQKKVYAQMKSHFAD